MRKTFLAAIGLALAAAVGDSSAWAQVPADPVDPAIRLVNQGEFENAFAALNQLISDLEGKPERAKDLARAYLYRGVALAGLGRDDEATDSFRKALGADKRVHVSPALFSPRVIRLFEAAGGKVAEVKAGAGVAAAGGPALQTGGPSKAPLVVSGVIAVAAPVAALATTGKSDNGSSGNPSENCDPNGVVEASFNLVEGTVACAATTSSSWGTVTVSNRSCSTERVTLVITGNIRVNQFGWNWPRWTEIHNTTITPGAQANIYNSSGYHLDCHDRDETDSPLWEQFDDVFTVQSATGIVTKNRTITFDRALCPPCN